MRNGDSGQADALDLSSGLKYEIDALANKDFEYLTRTYLPKNLKRRRMGWISPRLIVEIKQPSTVSRWIYNMSA